MAFLIAGKRGGGGPDEGLWAPSRLGFHLHTLPRRSQSSTEEAPVSLSQSPTNASLTSHPQPLTHSSFIPPSLPQPKKRRNKITLVSRCFPSNVQQRGESSKQMELTGGSKWVQAWEGGGDGVVEQGSKALGPGDPHPDEGVKLVPRTRCLIASLHICNVSTLQLLLGPRKTGKQIAE